MFVFNRSCVLVLWTWYLRNMLIWNSASAFLGVSAFLECSKWHGKKFSLGYLLFLWLVVCVTGIWRMLSLTTVFCLVTDTGDHLGTSPLLLWAALSLSWALFSCYSCLSWLLLSLVCRYSVASKLDLLFQQFFAKLLYS